MKLLKVKTVRFAQVIARCGTPEVYTLWQRPGNDPHLQALLKADRLMTIKPRASGVDFGEVGLGKAKTASYLAFPKSLKRYRDACIVGIKWEMLRS